MPVTRTDRILLSSSTAPQLSSSEERGYMRAALAENAFARLNYEALIGDGSRADYRAKLPNGGTYADAFKAAVVFVDGEPVIDHERLLASGALAPTVTLARLQSILRFGSSAQESVSIAQAERSTELPTPTAITPQARPAGWATLGPVAAMEDNKPVKSGWYLRVRLAWPDEFFSTWLGSHSSFGYYDATTRTWGMSSSLNYEYEPATIPIPGIGGEMAIDENPHKFSYYEVAMGPEALRQGLTPEAFHRAMRHDVVKLEAHYRSLSGSHRPERRIFYQFVPSQTSRRIDGNCNTYAHYLLASLGVDGVYPHGPGANGTAGQEVIARDKSGDVYIFGSGRAAQAVRAPPNQKPVIEPPRTGKPRI